MSTIKTLLSSSILAGLAVSCSPAHADPAMLCPQHFANGESPIVYAQFPGDRQTLCFEDFAVLYSNESKTPVYVAHHLNKEKLEQARKVPANRSLGFHSEPSLLFEDSARTLDYEKSAYTSAPLFPIDEALSAQTKMRPYSLANTVPARRLMVNGAWTRAVERPLRQYISRSDNEFYIITGPIYDEEPEKIGDSEVWVPSALFKFVYDATEGMAWGYMVENLSKGKSKGIYAYDEMLDATGIAFLPEHGIESEPEVEEEVDLDRYNPFLNNY